MSVSYRLDESVAVITMDDGKVNALSETMLEALLAAMAEAGMSPNSTANVAS